VDVSGSRVGRWAAVTLAARGAVIAVVSVAADRFRPAASWPSTWTETRRRRCRRRPPAGSAPLRSPTGRGSVCRAATVNRRLASPATAR